MSVDVLLYVALSEEFNYVLQALGVPFEHEEATNTALTYFRAEIHSPELGRDVLIVVVPAGKMGNTRAAAITSDAIGRYNPRNVVVLGIAGSLTDDLNPGDVFIPDSVNEYLANAASRSEGERWTFVTSGNRFETSRRLLNRFANFRNTQKEYHTQWEQVTAQYLGALVDQSVRAKLVEAGLALPPHSTLYAADDKTLASGPAVGKGTAFGDWIKGHIDRKVAAMEMESAGVYDAALMRLPSPRAIAIRAISDFADERKQKIEKLAGTGIRVLAVKNAVSLLVAGIKAGLFRDEAEDSDSRPRAPSSASIPATGPAVVTLDRITQAAISPERRDSIELPGDDATPRTVYQTAIKLRAGRMLERILSSTMVRRYRDPFAVFMCALDDEKVTAREFETIAPWLRLSADSHGVESIAERVCKKLNLSDVNSVRMKAELMGWAGCTLLPNVNWEDRWCKEKFSFYFAKAFLHAAWKDQAEHSLRFLVRSCIDANENYKSYYNRDMHFFDFMSAVKGIPASNSKILLNEMIAGGAPPAMMSALLYRMCVTPTLDAIPDLIHLARHADRELADAARTALAFVPARSDTVRELKRSALVNVSAPFAAAAGVDLLTDAISELGALLELGTGGVASYNAAWALNRMTKLSHDASRYVREGAFEHPDKIVRCICLIGQAIEVPREAEAHIADEYASARDIEKFCLSIALTYTSDAREMLSLLASTGEDRVYVPYLNTCFQLLFRDAMKHAAAKSPILGEMLLLTDDT
jgi:nucleoside phosphorylase